MLLIFNLIPHHQTTEKIKKNFVHVRNYVIRELGVFKKSEEITMNNMGTLEMIKEWMLQSF